MNINLKFLVFPLFLISFNCMAQSESGTILLISNLKGKVLFDN